MFSAIVFALLSVASAQYLPQSYSSVDALGVNPAIVQQPVPHLSYNAQAVRTVIPQSYYGGAVLPQTYASKYINNVIPQSYYSGAVIPQTYAAKYVQNVVPQSYYSGAVIPQTYASKYVQNVVPHAYEGAAVQRDYDIESIGERHSLQNGPVSFQYSFVRGNDARVVDSPVVARYAADYQPFAAKLRVAGPAVRNVDILSGKQYI